MQKYNYELYKLLEISQYRNIMCKILAFYEECPVLYGGLKSRNMKIRYKSKCYREDNSSYMQNIEHTNLFNP